MEGRMIDDIELQVDTDLFQLCLRDLHGVEHAGQRGLDYRDLEAVGKAGIGQKLLRLHGVVGIERRLLVGAEVVVWNDRHRLASSQRTLELHHVGPVQPVGDRLADSDIVERFLGDIETDVGKLAGTEHVDHRARQSLHALRPGLILAAVEEVDLA